MVAFCCCGRDDGCVRWRGTDTAETTASDKVAETAIANFEEMAAAESIEQAEADKRVEAAIQAAEAKANAEAQVQARLKRRPNSRILQITGRILPTINWRRHRMFIILK